MAKRRPDPLETYREKRDFAVTNEPAPISNGRGSGSVSSFMVQTADHPLEYGNFEGRIPDGEYELFAPALNGKQRLPRFGAAEADKEEAE